MLLDVRGGKFPTSRAIMLKQSYNPFHEVHIALERKGLSHYCRHRSGHADPGSLPGLDDFIDRARRDWLICRWWVRGLRRSLVFERESCVSAGRRSATGLRNALP